MEILLLSGGTPNASFRDLAHAWGRDKGFHHALASSVCERRGDIERKRRSDAGKTLTTEQKEAFKQKLRKKRASTNASSIAVAANVATATDHATDTTAAPTAATVAETAPMAAPLPPPHPLNNAETSTGSDGAMICRVIDDDTNATKPAARP